MALLASSVRQCRIRRAQLILSSGDEASMHTVSRISCNGCLHFRISALFLITLLSVAVPARANQSTMEATLRSGYEKKLVILRHFYSDSKLHFDKEGKLLGNSPQGYCTSDSTIQIESLSIDKHHVLTIKGRRVLNLFDEKTGRFSNLITNQHIQISIELDPTWQEPSQAGRFSMKLSLPIFDRFSRCPSTGNAGSTETSSEAKMVFGSVLAAREIFRLRTGAEHLAALLRKGGQISNPEATLPPRARSMSRLLDLLSWLRACTCRAQTCLTQS